MKLPKKNRPLSKNPLTWLVLLLVLVLTFVILEKTHVIDVMKAPATPALTPEQEAQQKKTDRAKKQEFIKETPEATPVAPPQDSSAITITAEQDGSTVSILTKLKDFSGGSCELSISNGAKTHTTSAEVIYQPEFSSCAGFAIPVSQLGSGQWTIVLNATPTGGSKLTKTISVEVK